MSPIFTLSMKPDLTFRVGASVGQDDDIVTILIDKA